MVCGILREYDESRRFCSSSRGAGTKLQRAQTNPCPEALRSGPRSPSRVKAAGSSASSQPSATGRSRCLVIAGRPIANLDVTGAGRFIPHLAFASIPLPYSTRHTEPLVAIAFTSHPQCPVSHQPVRPPLAQTHQIIPTLTPSIGNASAQINNLAADTKPPGNDGATKVKVNLLSTRRNMCEPLSDNSSPAASAKTKKLPATNACSSPPLKTRKPHARIWSASTGAV